MSFWDLSDGESAITGAKEYEAPTGGNFDPFPDGLRVIAEIESAAWKYNQNGNEERISIKYAILEPEAYAGRKTFQALWVTDDNPNKTGDAIAKKRDADKQQFAKVDDCAGGKLARMARKPTDDDMALALHGKVMAIEFGLFQPKEEGKDAINWVRNVYPKAKGVSIPNAPAKPKPAPKPAASQTRGGFGDDLDSDVPF